MPDPLLVVESPSGRVSLTRDDVASEVAFVDLLHHVPDDPRATHVTFHATDGYAACLPMHQALADARLQVPEDGRAGVRLVVSDGSTTCLNVKAVTRIELTIGPGKHTVDPNPHEPARVPGWDD